MRLGRVGKEDNDIATMYGNRSYWGNAKKLSPYVVYNLYTGDRDDQWESSDWSRDCRIFIATKYKSFCMRVLTIISIL